MIQKNYPHYTTLKLFFLYFTQISKKKLELFEEAKQRVLFEGFEYDKENDWVTYNEFARFFVSELQNGKVEDLFKLIKDEITLTETSKKEIGYETT